MSLAVIEIIDLFLVGTVAYIAAIGLYKLFISSEEVVLPMRLNLAQALMCPSDLLLLDEPTNHLRNNFV